MSTVTRTRSQVNQTTKRSITPVSRTNQAVKAQEEEPAVQYENQGSHQETGHEYAAARLPEGMSGLDDAGAFLSKSRLTPSKSQLRSAHQTSPKPVARRGQFIDILV